MPGGAAAAQPSATQPPLKVKLATPRGFCAGVERAIEIVERALRVYGAPVYVRHEIVHNRRVVEELEAKGAIFVEEVDEIPQGAVTIFSAHGVARRVEAAAADGGLKVIDATCPLVAKVHKQGRGYAGQDRDVVLIGHRGHPEVEGTLGQIDGRVQVVGSVAEVAELAPRDPSRIAYVTQTTLSVDDTRGIIAALTARFPEIQGPDTRDICYATQNRQTAVRALAAACDLVLVVGAPNSSNSNRLREIAAAHPRPAYLVPDAGALDPDWLDGVDSVGITAGASAPEQLVRELIEAISARRPVTVELLPGAEETVQFRLPEELVDA
mgnify:CR=1 FL=1